MTRQDVVIVGAGMAGLVCARRLQGAGYQTCLIEKSRGLGGRMATRRMEGIPTDHGARYLQPQETLLMALTEAWVKQGLMTPWVPQTYILNAAGQLRPEDTAEPYYVAPMGMSSIGKALAANLVIHKQQRVTAIAPSPGNTWQITAVVSTDNQTVQHTAKAIVLAIPAPQILPLLEPLRSQPEIAVLWAQLRTVRYTPCIT
ncbi:MAG: FAD-dependent oxidoreductase, partial [Cyanobacteria bacterium P01_H01_bin.58]